MATTITQQLDLYTPQEDANQGNSGWKPVDIGTKNNFGSWFFKPDVEGKIFAKFKMPSNYDATGAVKIRLAIHANATSGVTRLSVSHRDVNDAENYNGAETESIAAQDITVPTTAFIRKDVEFTLGTKPAVNDDVDITFVHEGDIGADTLAVNTLLRDGEIEFDVN